MTHATYYTPKKIARLKTQVYAYRQKLKKKIGLCNRVAKNNKRNT